MSEYTVYGADELPVAFGTPKECARALGKSLTAFRSMASRYTTGKVRNKSYEIVKEIKSRPQKKTISNRKRKRAVACYDPQSGEKVSEYQSITRAARSVYKGDAKKTSNICAACKGRIKTAYGYVWRYAEAEKPEKEEENDC